MSRRSCCVLLLAATVTCMAADNAQLVKDFEARVAGYVDLEKKQAGSPKPTDSPNKLAETQEQIAEKMRAARPDAKQGDIFSPEITAYFRRQIAAALSGHDGKKIRASLRHAEPVEALPLQVNARYPEKTPLQSTPPTLLLNLPRLPRELEYRIAGRDLLLYDPQAGLIVDFIQEAISRQPALSNQHSAKNLTSDDDEFPDFH